MNKTGRQTWKCWQCGHLIQVLILPLSRREECPACRAELHVCRMCTNYDPRVGDHCREDRAEAVTDATHSNFCDYFNLSTDAWRGDKNPKEAAAKNKLDALFGGTAENGDNTDNEGELSKEEAARRELDRLFGADK
jgi:hypothetical protein